MENTISDEGWEELFNEEDQQTSTDQGEVEVMDHEGAIQGEGFAVFHQFSSSKDNDIV